MKTAQHPPKTEKKIVIHIDRKQYKVDQECMTGEELRQLAEPPVGDDRDLWQQVPGPGDDIKIEKDDKVKLHNGIHFYTAPSTINPGS